MCASALYTIEKREEQLFSGIRVSLAVAKGLEISNKISLFGYKDKDLKSFDQENIEKLIDENLIEKKLIKPSYLS